jgi:hypothetical protein
VKNAVTYEKGQSNHRTWSEEEAYVERFCDDAVLARWPPSLVTRAVIPDIHDCFPDTMLARQFDIHSETLGFEHIWLRDVSDGQRIVKWWSIIEAKC